MPESVATGHPPDEQGGLPSAQAALAGSAGNVWNALALQIERTPSAPALLCRGEAITYAQLGARVRAMAQGLAADGVREGDRVAVLSENSPAYLVLFFACAMLGAIAACQNWRQSRRELAHCLQLVQPRLVCVSPRFRGDVEQLGLADIPILDWEQLDRGEERAPDASPVPMSPGGEAGLYILYTSGTTGLPKAALISHRALLARMAVHLMDRPTAAGSAFVAWSPFFHMGATDFSLSTLLRGGKVVVMDGFDADALARVVVQEQIGHLTIVPGVVDRFLQAFHKLGRPARGVELVGVMADLVPPDQLAALTRALDAPYCNTFGATETGSPPASRGLVPVGAIPATLAKVQSSGCVIRLVDEHGRDVPDGEPGELLLRSATLFSGYWGDPEATREAFRGGWYHMGDVFRRNADRTLDFVDRRKYLIKSGGENIYPAEVEQALRSLPGVEDAVVVRHPDPRWGEVPVAFVVVADDTLTSEQILQGCRGLVAPYKIPRRLLFASATALPRNVSGKVERLRLETYLAAAAADLARLPEDAFSDAA